MKMWMFLRRALFGLCCIVSMGLQASQGGPVFPTHRFPTDRSFHVSYRAGWLTSISNFISPTVYQSLNPKSKLTLFKHDFLAEFQPNRRLSVGGILDITSASLNPSSGGIGVSATKLGDQRMFIEYRFYDAPGRSVGFALVSKFPGYKNPTVDDVVLQGATSAILMGDAQVDFSPLLTTEFWPSTTLRTRLDTGYTYRTEGFASEIPFLASLGYVNPRLDLDLRVRGNLSLGTKNLSSDGSISYLKTAFAFSDYAFADNPWTVILQPAVEFWLTSSFAVGFDFSYSLMGNDSAHFREMGLTLCFREATSLRRVQKTFQEVDIHTDQESGVFQGEVQGQPPPPQDEVFGEDSAY